MEDRPVTITCVKNPLKPLDSREFITVAPGRPIEDYIREFYPLAPPEMDVAVSLNGQVISSWEPGSPRAGSWVWCGGIHGLVLSPGDNLVFCVVPKGGGGGNGKNPMATVLMLAVIVAASAVSGGAAAGLGAAFAKGALGAKLLATGIMVAGGLLVNALFPAPVPDLGGPTFSNLSESPTYSWETSGNPVSEGVVRPVLYGRHRVTPPLIGRYVETDGDKQYLNLLYLVADHPLASISDIWLNDVPVENFGGVQTEIRLGSLDQEIIPFFNDTRSQVGVSTPLSTDWIERTTQGNGVQGLGIGITLPGGLYYANDRGGLDRQTVKVAIEYKEHSAGTWTQYKYCETQKVTVQVGRWSAGFYRTLGTRAERTTEWVEVEQGGTSPSEHTEGALYREAEWDRKYEYVTRPALCWHWMVTGTEVHAITVERSYVPITAATREQVNRVFYFDNLPFGTYDLRLKLYEALPSGTRYGNKTYWDFYEEKIYDDFTYPGTSLLAIRALATDKLSGGLPKVTCIADRGTVPVWTGAAYEDKPSNSPAWAAYDMLHDDHYGANVLASRIDYASFAAWAAYCAGEDFQINAYFDADSSIRRSLDVCGTLGRGSVIQIGTKFTVLMDRPDTNPVQRFMFAMGNILRDSFSEEFLPMDQRADLVEVTYFDQDQDYTRQTVTIEGDSYNTTTQAVNKTSVTLVGETRRYYAARYGRFLLNQCRYVTLTATWKAAVDSIACLPGDVVEVSHDVPQWGYSGRLISASANQVVLDRPVIREPGKSYYISVQLADSDERTSASVQTPAQETETATLPLSGAWDNGTPDKDDLYLFGQVGRASKLMRVTRITRASDQTREITAVEYVPEIYADKNNLPPVVNVSDLLPVSGLSAHEVWTLGPDGSGRSVIVVSWRGFAVSWAVYLREEGGDWQFQSNASRPQFTIDVPLNVGAIYYVAVTSGNAPVPGSDVSLTILGKAAPPSDVTNFKAWPAGDRVVFSWDHVPDVDRWGYKVRQGASWATGETILNLEQKNTGDWRPPLSGTYQFWIKAVDDSGLESVNAAGCTCTVSVSGLNIVLTADEIPTGATSGTYDNLVYLATPQEIAWIPGLVDTDVSAFTDQDL
ncbi:MAG: host specificity factor TipJ family phage tail protein, partial [Thermodesulfobacteriota bacterium]